MVKTGIWEDEEYIDTHSTEDRYLYLYLLTCPNRHMSGILKPNFRIMASHLGWDKQQVHIVMDRLEVFGDIVTSGTFVLVKGYFDHNCNPGPTHYAQINSRLQEISIELLEIWIDDAIERSLPVDKIYKGPHILPSTYPIDTPSIPYPYPIDGVGLNNNTNNNDTGICKDNNNYNVVSGCDLHFPSKLEKGYIEPMLKLIEYRLDAQDLLDELAAKLDKENVKNPIGFVAAIIKNGLIKSPGGINKEKQRKEKGW